MKKEIKTICEICKKSFLGYNHRPNKFCSRQCCGKAKLGKKTWITGKKAVWNTGDKNHRWKGENAGIIAKHAWVRRHFPHNGFCEICNNEHKILDLATKIRGFYSKEREDYMYLCRSCHRRYDGFTETQLEKMSLAKKGKPSWNKGTNGICKPNSHSFKKGHVPPQHQPYCKCFRCSKHLV